MSLKGEYVKDMREFLQVRTVMWLGYCDWLYTIGKTSDSSKIPVKENNEV